MSHSHLYQGFRFASVLPSIRAQREIQRKILHILRIKTLLVLGCAFGDELAQLLEGITYMSSDISVTAIDLASVEDALRAHTFAKVLGPHLKWRSLDLLDAAQLPEYGEFDVVQCGFVLHDVPYDDKDRAMAVLSGAIRPGGHLIISDMFISDKQDRLTEACNIYDAFLSEASSARNSGLLGAEEYRPLVGDGVQPGLHRSKKEATEGMRDFFDSLESLIDRFRKAGLHICRIEPNPINSSLSVILAVRPPTQRGLLDVGSSNVL